MFLCPRSRLKIWPRKTGPAVSSRATLLNLHTRAKSGACSQDSSRFLRRRLFIRPIAIGSVPTSSGHAIAYRGRSLPRVRRYRTNSPQSSTCNVCFLFRHYHGSICVRLSSPTRTIGINVDMCYTYTESMGSDDTVVISNLCWFEHQECLFENTTSCF